MCACEDENRSAFFGSVLKGTAKASRCKGVYNNIESPNGSVFTLAQIYVGHLN